MSLANLAKMDIVGAKSESQYSERLGDFVNHWTNADPEGTIHFPIIYFLKEEEISQVDKRTIIEICKKLFNPKDCNMQIPESQDQDSPETEYLLRKYRYNNKNIIFECFSDEIS